MIIICNNHVINFDHIMAFFIADDISRIYFKFADEENDFYLPFENRKECKDFFQGILDAYAANEKIYPKTKQHQSSCY